MLQAAYLHQTPQLCLSITSADKIPVFPFSNFKFTILKTHWISFHLKLQKKGREVKKG